MQKNKKINNKTVRTWEYIFLRNIFALFSQKKISNPNVITFLVLKEILNFENDLKFHS